MLRIHSGFIVMLIALVVCAAGLLSCDGKGDETPDKQVDAAEPDREIDDPMNPERITEDEYISTEMTMGNTGIIARPALPYEVGAAYQYSFMKDGSAVGKAEFHIEEYQDGGYMIQCASNVQTSGDVANDGRSMTQYLLNGNLRPVTYVRRTPLADGRTMSMKSVDFDREPFGVKIGGEDKAGEGFREIQKPSSEIWPLTASEALDLALIMACVDPMAERADLWVLDLDTERVGRLSLEAKGDEPYILLEEAMTITGRKWEASVDGVVFGSLIMTPDGRMVAVDLPGGLHGELQVVGGE
jgi:hypothetical protein